VSFAARGASVVSRQAFGADIVLAGRRAVLEDELERLAGWNSVLTANLSATRYRFDDVCPA
jgi:hypothetical protein